MLLTLDTFYTSKVWRKFRYYEIRKRRDSSGRLLCEHCGQPIFSDADTILHHKIELTENNVNDVNISLNPSNILVCHFNCHNEIHNRFGQGRQQVFIVHGSPCSGKSRFVSSVRRRDDLIIDMDYIYKMLNPYNDMYDKPNRLSTVAFQTQKRLLEICRDRFGMWQNCYIITCESIYSQLEKMAKEYNARLIHVDTPKEECIENLLRDKEKEFYKEYWLKYIDDYFFDYTSPEYDFDV